MRHDKCKTSLCSFFFLDLGFVIHYVCGCAHMCASVVCTCNVCASVVCTCMGYRACVEIRGQFFGVGALRPSSCESRGLDSGPRVFRAGVQAAEQLLWPLLFLCFVFFLLEQGLLHRGRCEHTGWRRLRALLNVLTLAFFP